jgi:hypothetical protein
VLACGLLVLVGLAHGPLKPVILAAHATAPAGDGTGTPARPAARNRSVDLHAHLRHFFVHVLAQIGLAHTGSGAADEKKDDKPAPAGTWERKEGEAKIDFPEKGVMKIYPHRTDVIVFVCKCAVEKDGLVKAAITGFEGKPEAREKAREKFPVDTEFTFKWTVKDTVATVADLKGEKFEPFKSILEGEYGKK